MTTITPNPDIQSDPEFVICPYCDAQYGDCSEFVAELPQAMICTTCGGEFTHEADHFVTYTTRPVRAPDDDVVADLAFTAAICAPDEAISALGDVVVLAAEVIGDGAAAVGDGLAVVGEGIVAVGEGIGDAFVSIFEAVLGE